MRYFLIISSIFLLSQGCSRSTKNTLLKSLYHSNENSLMLMRGGVERHSDFYSKLMITTPSTARKFENTVIVIQNHINGIQYEIDKAKVILLNRDKEYQDSTINGLNEIAKKYDFEILDKEILLLKTISDSISNETVLKVDFDYMVLFNILNQISSSYHLDDLILLQVLEKKLLIQEHQLFEQILSFIPKEKFPFTRLQPIVTLDKKIFNRGEPVKASISVAMYDIKQKYDIEMDGVPINFKDGIGYFEFKPTKKGEQTKDYLIRIHKKGTDEFAEFSGCFSYYVY